MENQRAMRLALAADEDKSRTIGLYDVIFPGLQLTVFLCRQAFSRNLTLWAPVRSVRERNGRSYSPEGINLDPIPSSMDTIA